MRNCNGKVYTVGTEYYICRILLWHQEMTIRDQEKHKMYFPSLCLENFYFDCLGMPVDCCFRLTLPVPLRIVTLCSLTGFLLSEFVSYRGTATKPQSIIMGSRLVDIAKISMIYPSSRCKTVVNWERSAVVVSAGLSSQTALLLSASDGSWRGTLLTRVSRDWQALAAAFLFLFSCSTNFSSSGVVSGRVWSWQKSWDRSLVIVSLVVNSRAKPAPRGLRTLISLFIYISSDISALIEMLWMARATRV